MCTPTPGGSAGRLNLLPNLQKVEGGGLDRNSVLRGGLLGRRGLIFFSGAAIFRQKNPTNSGMFNGKKV